MRPRPTAPLAAGTLILGYAVAVLSGSRPLGGLILVVGGLCCYRVWTRHQGPREALLLATVGFAAFVVSHGLALLVGAWPSVLAVSAVMGAVAWVRCDARRVAPVPEGL